MARVFFFIIFLCVEAIEIRSYPLPWIWKKLKRFTPHHWSYIHLLCAIKRILLCIIYNIRIQCKSKINKVIRLHVDNLRDLFIFVFYNIWHWIKLIIYMMSLETVLSTAIKQKWKKIINLSHEIWTKIKLHFFGFDNT